MRLATSTALIAALAATLTVFGGLAHAQMGDMPVDTGAAASVPMAVLSSADVSLYRQIFADEREGRFDDAKQLFGQLSDTSLEGYVLAEHYLSPHGHASLDELLDWMHQYGELPVADRIYRLAVERATKRVKKKHHKFALVMTASVPVPAGPPRRRGGGYEEFDASDPALTSDAGKTAQAQIEHFIKADQPEQAQGVLDTARAGGVPDYDVARLASRVSASYIAEGEDQQAYTTATSITGSMRQVVPTLDWYAGFAAYRMGNYQDAAAHLEILAQAGSVPNYLRSQAAFWAARAHLRDGDPQRAVTLLQAAAREEPTFYGIIAERILGQDTQTGFKDPVLTAADFSAIMAVPSAHRAVALSQVGEEKSDIPNELNRAFGDSDGRNDMGYAAIARRVNATNIELRASETYASRGILLTGLFPVPGYKPQGGYTIDPSLVLAFIRCESRFVADAVSHAGAHGLMQLMPGTAVKFGGNGAVSALHDPQYNMSIGQRYIAFLLNNYNGNLVQVPAAYNAGSLRVAGWMNARAGKEDDALEFIESIRISETRYYVKRLLMYQWLYSRRLGEPTLSLDAMTAGNWPIYHPPAQPPPPAAALPAVPAVPAAAGTVVSDARY
ncbi:MAG TPA: lytic transglycosylase domain-containing protein [Rhizomicrobium sp.]|jgi:soluble lytic murein transglycosylase-like protein|nr:lytic transglycosylase domain-containing protein [Rhizomicrobium sp.]